MSTFEDSVAADTAPATAKYAKLKVWFDPEHMPAEILLKYKQHIEDHNRAVLNDPHPNSGFDLFITETEFFKTDYSTKLINHQIKCTMYHGDNDNSCAFYLYPRSSIYKTPFMLANSTGIIDSGYRGYICSAVRYFNEATHTDGDYLTAGMRITQICHPSLCPILVEIVNSDDDLGSTTRGEDGFGSTGR